jgi:hypothetical protein
MNAPDRAVHAPKVHNESAAQKPFRALAALMPFLVFLLGLGLAAGAALWRQSHSYDEAQV